MVVLLCVHERVKLFDDYNELRSLKKSAVHFGLTFLVIRAVSRVG